MRCLHLFVLKLIMLVLAQEYNGHKYLKRYIYERAMCDLCQKTFELEKAYLCQCKLDIHVEFSQCNYYCRRLQTIAFLDCSSICDTNGLFF